MGPAFRPLKKKGASKMSSSEELRRIVLTHGQREANFGGARATRISAAQTVGIAKDNFGRFED
jgi:hypothetical protein